MTSREEMLDRVRKAVGRTMAGGPAPVPPALDLTGVMPSVAAGDLLAKFEMEWEKVGGVAHRAANLEELDQILHKILDLAGTHSAVLTCNPLLAELRIADRLTKLNNLVTGWTTGADASDALPAFNRASFAAGVGISGADFVLAESGTLVLSSLTEGAQVASLAPPVHVTLYRRNQLVGSLDEVLAQLPISNPPNGASPGRSVVFITGTSRTADIEQILIRGVHGPRAAHAILVDDGH